MFVWTIWDAIEITFLVIVALGFLLAWLASAMKVALCKHDGGVNETMACDAICCKCGSNLGFIGKWREKESARVRASRKVSDG